MKKPTLKQLIESAEKEVKPEDWYRLGLIKEVFHGISAKTIVSYCNEMLEIPDFAEGIIKPGPSTTFVHIHTFIWFLRWKDENKYRSKKLSPTEVLER